MNPLLLEAIMTMGKSLINSVFPDPAQKADAQMKLLAMQQAGEFKDIDANLQLMLAQIANNTADANSASFFRGGWRPFIGWVCGSGLAYQFLLRPIAQMVIDICGVQGVVMATLDLTTLMSLLFGILGLGTLRTVEKVKGLA